MSDYDSAEDYEERKRRIHRIRNEILGIDYVYESSDDIPENEVPINDVGSNTMEIMFPVTSHGHSRQQSPISVISGIPWCLEMIYEDKTQVLAVTCNPKNRSRLWTCEATVELTVISVDASPNYVLKKTHVFNSMNNSVRLPVTDLKPTKSFIVHKRINFRATVNVKKIIGIKVINVINFESPRPNITDVVLVVNKAKLHVSKAYLATHSQFFYNLFYSDFQEKNKDEIELHELELDQFVEMLYVIHPCEREITDKTVSFLLELAERFDVPYVTSECQRYLIGTTTTLSVMEKLKLAEKYCLLKVQEHCMDKLRSIYEVREMVNTSDYRGLSDDTKLMILESAVQRH